MNGTSVLMAVGVMAASVGGSAAARSSVMIDGGGLVASSASDSTGRDPGGRSGGSIAGIGGSSATGFPVPLDEAIEPVILKGRVSILRIPAQGERDDAGCGAVSSSSCGFIGDAGSFINSAFRFPMKFPYPLSDVSTVAEGRNEPANSDPTSESQPKPRMMLLAGLTLIGFVIRRRLTDDASNNAP